MPHQTVTSPCYSCKHGKCKVCEFDVYANHNEHHLSIKEKNKLVENLWRENEDIAWDENENGELVLGQPWRGFPVGKFTQDDWFHWVDYNHQFGVGWVYENISPYDFEVEGVKQEVTMRDPNRLDAEYEFIKKIHKECFPDWRITQLFENFFRWVNSNKCIAFYVEDGEKLHTLLEEFANMYK